MKKKKDFVITSISSHYIHPPQVSQLVRTANDPDIWTITIEYLGYDNISVLDILKAAVIWYKNRFSGR